MDRRAFPAILKITLVASAVLAPAAAQTLTPERTAYEGQPAFLLKNDRISLSVVEQGGALADLHLISDPERLNPYWNPVRMARELGQELDPKGTQGHFVCVDGFGPESAEERAAGLPQHGEARTLKWDVTGYLKNGKTAELSFRTHLPVVQENFSRTLRLIDGENVIYVDSTLESELGFDRPVSWAEHFTLGSPFLAPVVTQTTISGTRAQTRPYTGTGNANAQRRLAGGR